MNKSSVVPLTIIGANFVLQARAWYFAGANAEFA